MNNPEELFLRRFFAALNGRKIRYAVMRNSETLPETLGGSDLDVFAYDEDEGWKVFAVAGEIAAELNGKCVCRYIADEIVACFCGRHADGTFWGLHIDIVTGVKHRGFSYVDKEAFLADRILEKDCFYRSGRLSDIVSFLKEICCNHKTKKNYYELALAAFASEPERIRCAIQGVCGDMVWAEIEWLLSTKRSDAEIAEVSKRLDSAFAFRSGTRNRFVNAWRRMRRVFIRPGFTVAFLGTDGSGKSTLIESVTAPIGRMLHSKVHYEHLRPNMLPSLARLAGKPQKEGPTTDPHGGKVAGRISSLVRFAYYYVDYVVGYWLKIYPILVKRPSMVFFDRYYYEYMIDPRRCAVRLPRGWARFWSWFIPKPDLILCLGGDPEKIYARKPETSLEEVQRQVAELKCFCDGNKRAVWIDTTTSIESSRDAALMAITEKMAARYK